MKDTNTIDFALMEELRAAQQAEMWRTAKCRCGHQRYEHATNRGKPTCFGSLLGCDCQEFAALAQGKEPE